MLPLDDLSEKVVNYLKLSEHYFYTKFQELTLTFERKHDFALKFCTDNEKNVGFLLIPTSQF